MSGVLGSEPAPVGDEPFGVDHAVLAYAQDRGITEVLHFTTGAGLLGTVATGSVLSRDRLREEQYLAYIALENCPDRSRDAAWTGYVSMSVTQINRSLLESSRRWHPEEDISWCVLAFDVAILGHPDVVFANSNNAYPITKRDSGVTGLAGMFADAVKWGYYNTVERRKSWTPNNMPTHAQAEVLYPDRVPLRWLRSIYVLDHETADHVEGLYAALDTKPRVPVVCKPEVFA
ncbi:DarT ssDNA thymidine ADP-ribosyltransferase family protein [Actinophytocola algeriensis]|uniref:DarT domain-containing protein n=1 Tax=Actinophytocola algeriensis TaxID=1768010 RepID=A0A7W7VHN3_9PSEU|nr:DarT ssDNA thymidine ADP-ribosyltransferase family protein [Actinophytocola algeriensis]MBB4910606.1 hypothetical protein [Actinophytocola algeriensis]MBE1480406.1 hypothetical protein [Actinophytocola algeriensis]